MSDNEKSNDEEKSEKRKNRETEKEEAASDSLLLLSESESKVNFERRSLVSIFSISQYTETITYGEDSKQFFDENLYPVLKNAIDSDDYKMPLQVHYAGIEDLIPETTRIMYKTIAKQYGTYEETEHRRVSSIIIDTEALLFKHPIAEDHFIYFILPPDGGISWIITLVSFLCQLLISGILYAIGSLLPRISADLGVSDVKVTLIPTSQIGLFFLFMPISTALFNNFGFRSVNLSAAFLAAIALLGAAYSPGTRCVMFSFSILGGLTFSILHTSSILRISLFFQKYRAIAHAITCSGVGAGIVIFFFINNFIMAQYHWRQVMKCYSLLLGILFLILLKHVKIMPRKIFKVEVPPTSDGSMLVSEIQEKESIKTMSYIRSITFKNKKLGRLFIPFTSSTVLNTGLCERILLSRCKYEDIRISSNSSILKPDLIEIQDLFYTGPAKYIFANDAYLAVARASLFLIANEGDVND